MAGTWVYFDTSALLKRYINEAGSTAVQRLLRRHECLSSALTPEEVIAVLLKRRREGELSQAKFQTLLRQVQNDRLRWDLVEVSPLVLERAEAIIQGFIPIGLLDAIQVASLMTFQAESAMQVPLATASARQRDSATQRGLEVIWVG